MTGIENIVAACTTCVKFRSLKNKEALITYDIPDIPFNL